MTEITVTISESFDECDHAGCSGPEIVTITAKKGEKAVCVECQSCFGVDREKLLAELLKEWDKPPVDCIGKEVDYWLDEELKP